MTAHNSRAFRSLALGLGLALAVTAARDAQASPIPYGTIGSVDVPTGGVPNQVYFNGTNGTFDPDSPGQISLGNFVVSSLSMQPGTPNVNFVKNPFEVVIYSGAQASAKVTGVLDGVIGPTADSPHLTATFTGITPYTSTPLPFEVKLPLNSPLNLSLSDGSSAASTTMMVPASGPAPIPEPTSVAVFALALGGLGFWRHRRTGR